MKYITLVTQVLTNNNFDSESSMHALRAVTSRMLKLTLHPVAFKHLKKILRPKKVYVVYVEWTGSSLLETSGIFLNKVSANKRVAKLEKEYEAEYDEIPIVYIEPSKLLSYEKPLKR